MEVGKLITIRQYNHKKSFVAKSNKSYFNGKPIDYTIKFMKIVGIDNDTYTLKDIRYLLSDESIYLKKEFLYTMYNISQEISNIVEYLYYNKNTETYSDKEIYSEKEIKLIAKAILCNSYDLNIDTIAFRMYASLKKEKQFYISKELIKLTLKLIQYHTTHVNEHDNSQAIAKDYNEGYKELIISNEIRGNIINTIIDTISSNVLPESRKW